MAFRILGDRAEAEEVAQEALARASARWRTVDGHAEPCPGPASPTASLPSSTASPRTPRR
ncbi:MAG: hypothetical protein H0W25_03730 [Acidimicrobiia bacterium]|nr:hypothetical protein [Acidimicrobiia bacterium]